MFLLECTDTVQFCYNARKILIIVKTFIKILQFSIPLLLIFLGTIDMFKAVTKGGDQKAVQDATKAFVRRLIYGVIVFLVPFLVRLVLGLVEKNMTIDGEISTTSWVSCWNNADNKNSDYFAGCGVKSNKSTESNTNNTSNSSLYNNNSSSNSSNVCNICSKGTYSSTSKKCIWSTSKPNDMLPEDNNCKSACGTKSSSYSEYQSSGIDMCMCYSDPSC